MECLLAKQLSSYGYVGIEHSTVLYGESFWCKRRKSCIRLSGGPCQCCFPVKSHGQPSPCPEMSSSSGLFKLLAALIGALWKCQQPVYGWLSFMGGHNVIYHVLFIARPPSCNTGRERAAVLEHVFICCIDMYWLREYLVTLLSTP